MAATGREDMEKKRESLALGIRVTCLAREVSKQVRDSRQPYGEAEMGFSVREQEICKCRRENA